MNTSPNISTNISNLLIFSYIINSYIPDNITSAYFIHLLSSRIVKTKNINKTNSTLCNLSKLIIKKKQIQICHI